MNIFLDVDGVLLPMGLSDAWTDWTTYDGVGTASVAMGDALSPAVGKITWATTWLDLANKHISPIFGWGELPVVSRREEIVWWKLEAIRRTHPLRQPLVWVDDEIDQRNGETRGWVRSAIAELTDTHLLICPDSFVGLTPKHVDRILAFVDTHQ